MAEGAGWADRAWDPAPDWASFRIELPGLLIAAGDPGPLQIASGAIDRALAAAGLEAPSIGWPGPASGRRHAVRLARDRCLIVGAALEEGWHEAGFAVTELSDGLIAFTLEGQRMARALLALGEINVDRPSPSAARILSGYRAVAYLHDGPERLKILIARPAAPGFADLLSRIAPLLQED